MDATQGGRPRRRPRRRLFLFLAAFCVVWPRAIAAQDLTGALIGTVRDAQGGVLPHAVVRIRSPALIGGPQPLSTNDNGQFRFPGLPPGLYDLDVQMPGFSISRVQRISIGVGATVARAVVLTVAGIEESVVVEGAGSRIGAGDPGVGTRFGPDDLGAIPTRRASMFDSIRATPGVSPTSPSSGTNTTISAFGSGVNENQFLFDGTNFTCPCNGVARAEPGVDFIQEIQIQSVGASAEFGNVQGAVINVITRQGGERFLYDASYYAQTGGLTSQPVRLPYGASKLKSGYERARYRDFTTDLGGPAIHDRLWFFAGYQYLRDYDSQPGTDPAYPRVYEQNKLFAKLTWRLTPALRLLQSWHEELWVNPVSPTLVAPFETTTRPHGRVPAVTFGHLTHTLSANTVWDIRVGRFVYDQRNPPSAGDATTPSRFDRATGMWSGAPRQVGAVTIMRTTAKATLSRYQPGLLGVDHEWRVGAQVERGEHHASGLIPTGVRFVDTNGGPFQAISSAPSNSGGLFITAAAFVSDALAIGDRLTINAGLRFDHSRATSQDLHAIDLEGRETSDIVAGLGTLYVWNIVSPRLGVAAKLTADGRTKLRASYGRFSQGVLTGELAPFHPGVSPITTTAFDPATGGYTRVVSTVDQGNLRLNTGMRAPRTDEYSLGVDREIGPRVAVAIAYVRKAGANFIGWTDVGGQYREEVRSLPDGRVLPVWVLANSANERRFLLTNPAGYSLAYDGLVIVAEKRRSHGWQAFGSYTLSRASGLQPSSGTNAAGAQVSTVGPPGNLTFGQDPNDLTNARGRLPNDRPHVLRAMGSLDVPRTGFVVAANFQYFSGKPWAATAQFLLPQGDQRVQLETRGARRLSSQTPFDVRVSRTLAFGGLGRVELILDVLNVLNDTAEEGVATDTLISGSFGHPVVFVDPRRAMVSVRLNLGR